MALISITNHPKQLKVVLIISKSKQKQNLLHTNTYQYSTNTVPTQYQLRPTSYYFTIMYAYSLLLIAAAFQAATASTNTTRALRRQPTEPTSRRLMNEVTCHLYIRDIEYKPTTEYPNGHGEEEWDCEFGSDDIDNLGIAFAKIEQRDFIDVDADAREHNVHDQHFEDAISGVSTLTVNRAIIDVETMRMYLPSDAIVQVRTERDRSRRLTMHSGDLKTIMVRVIDSVGNEPSKSIDELRDDVFNDASCLKSQFQKCSYNKLRIQPYQDIGVFDLHVDVNTNTNPNGDQLHNAALIAFMEKFGDPFDSNQFDLVMFCNPPTSSHDGAWGQVNGPISNYADDWCSSVAGQMHEVGHNLGLMHSGDGSNEYGDTTGYMGSTPTDDDFNMCFNAAKNWQLGWYEDQSKSFNPLNANDPVTTVVLNGVVDYGKNPDAFVTVRLEETDKDTDYYIGYNRKAGMNSDTSEGFDMVTVLIKDHRPEVAAKSRRVALLPVGNSVIIGNFNNQQRKVEIKFVGSVNNLRDATVEIIDYDHKPVTPPEACEKHIVEIKTDSYPEDTSWILQETQGAGRGFGVNPNYDSGNSIYKTEVCLPYDMTYRFTIYDGFGDGVCCGQGSGYYKIFNSKNQLKVEGGEFQGLESKTFSVGSNPTPVPPPTPFPTRKPTNMPTPVPTQPPVDNGCKEYTIEIKTDNFPEDTSWKILNIQDTTEFERTSFNQANTVTTDKVCLMRGNEFKFVLEDKFGDGICCQQGNGYYTMKDASGTVVVEGETGGFKTREHKLTVDLEDTPPPPPSECKEYTVEIKTDNFPEDSSWKIFDPSGSEFSSRNSFDQANTVFKNTVCLEQNTDYKFKMVDKFNDGLCCQHGNGYYKVKDASGNVVVDMAEGAFGTKEHTISVGGDDVDTPPPPPAPKCEDRSGRFRWKEKSAKRTCKFWSKKKCNTINKFTNEPIWKECPVACGKCDDL